MSDEWVDEGLTGNSVAGDVATTIATGGLSAVLEALLESGAEEHYVRNKETGETRKLWVNPGQSVGDAIANGQWSDQ